MLRKLLTALSSFQRWRRDGPYSPVENRLPPGHRVGYERYTADGHYANLAAAFLAVAVSNGLNRPFAEPPGGREASLLLEHDPTFRAVLHIGPYSLHFNASPAPDYDAFGVVDLTFGPGRFLQFVSSAMHLESGRFLNLGMAGDSGSGFALISRMEGGLTPPRLEIEARDKGSGKWFVRNDPYACVSCSFMFDEEYSLEPGEGLVLDYRVVFGDGAWPRERIEDYVDGTHQGKES